jgi:hypothetical protein
VEHSEVGILLLAVTAIGTGHISEEVQPFLKTSKGQLPGHTHTLVPKGAMKNNDESARAALGVLLSLAIIYIFFLFPDPKHEIRRVK